MTMRSLHVLPNTPREASGYFASIYSLCQALIDGGHPAKLATLGELQSKFDKEFVKTFSCSPGLSSFGASPKMKSWLYRQVLSGQSDIVHAHSLWRMANIYPIEAVKNTQVKCIISPRGTLSPSALKYSFLSKKVFWYLFQRAALDAVTAFHATSEEEYKDIRKSGFLQPVAIIPNGIDVPLMVKKKNKPLKQVLYLGRIHPIKGIDNLLKAWQKVQDRHKGWQLVIVGPDDGCLPKMQALAKELALVRCEFVGPLYGTEKFKAYFQSDLYVLPTHSENFGMTVAEALATATPVIVTKGAPWKGLEKNKAGWWIDIGITPLVAALEQAFKLSDGDLEVLGLNGRNWMARDFSWNSVSEDMAIFYHWIIYGGRLPSFVRVD
jgi:glycosyltransferase involved in cell wall biosynthesis